MNRALSATTVAFCLALAPVAHGQDAAPATTKSDQANPVPDIVYIPTPHDIVARMLELASVTKSDVVYDLGCGDGRIVVAAARKHGCRAVGCDIDPNRVEASRNNVKRNKVQDRVTIEHQDLFKVDVRPASVVTVYLSAQYNTRLIPQFDSLRPGSRIVSHQFDMPGVKPDKIVQVASKEDGRKHTLYLWTTPLRK
jgi:protein-L-isoaspartate O-methyltransferase